MYILILALAILILLVKSAVIFRLSIPLLYALVVPTVFSEWFYSHYNLAYGIWYAMLAAVALSWAATIIRRVREWL